MPRTTRRTSIIAKNTKFEHRKFRQGIILFNSAEFFKAHEVWEELWLIATGTDKLFLQGMIQLAAAFHHLSRGNCSGTRTLLEASLSKLDKFPDEYRGVNLKAFRAVVQSCVDHLSKSETITTAEVPRIESTDQD